MNILNVIKNKLYNIPMKDIDIEPMNIKVDTKRLLKQYRNQNSLLHDKLRYTRKQNREEYEKMNLQLLQKDEKIEQLEAEIEQIKKRSSNTEILYKSGWSIW